MAPRIQPRINPPIAFAHRGARAHAPENTIEAFRLALEMGATGLESDVWLTRDGVPVLDHDGLIGSLRRRSIAEIDRSDLPPHIPTLREFYAMCGTDFEFSLDIKDPNAAEVVVAALEQTSAELNADLAPKTWFCHPDIELLAQWTDRWPTIRTVHSHALKYLEGGPERHAARLADAGIDCMNMRRPDWTGGLTTLFHRFDIVCFAWDVQLPRLLAEVFDLGIDGLYSDHTDRMMAARDAAFRT